MSARPAAIRPNLPPTKRAGELSFAPRGFIEDRQLLQREQKPGVSPMLTTAAYLVVGLIAALLVAALAAGVARLATAGRGSTTDRFTRGGTPVERTTVTR